MQNKPVISKPMLFSSEMVRAIFEGRKTQTRRIVKPQPIPDRYHPATRLEWNPGRLHYTECNSLWNPIANAFLDFIDGGHCPHPVGSQIWVKETFARLHNDMLQHFDPGPDSPHWFTAYRADGEPAHWEHFGTNWTLSIFMPKSASRITLWVTEVRVQRLQDISEEDALAEGIRFHQSSRVYGELGMCFATAKRAYEHLWESINGKSSWVTNPWVWAYTFKTSKP